MEDNTLDFLNPLEPLGTPGSANLHSNIPAISDPLKDPVINFPKDVAPLSYLQTREDLVDEPGKTSNATNQTIDREQILKSLGNMWKGKSLESAGQWAKSKAYSYDNSADSGSFYKRYQAYGQEKFDKIGFSPLRDNEAIFNENTSKWNDFNRMMTHSWWPLFKQGFIAGPKSLLRGIQGDFGVDLDDASVYAEAAAIGQSSKGGLGSFMSNAFMNFAYTAGIITESIVEMGAAALLAAPTGGSSLGLAGANLGRKGLMLGKQLDNLRKAGSIAPGLERAALSSLKGHEFANSLKALTKIDESRKLFNWAKLEKGMSSPVGRFLNPLAELSEGVATGLKASQNLNGWAKTMTMARHTAGGLYRNVHTINAALAEARLEGGMAENTVYDELYRYLTPEERNDESKLKDIRKQAQEAGHYAMIRNVGIIYASNKIVFDNIYGGKGPISRLMNKRTQDIMDLKTGKLRIVKPGKFGAAKDLKKPVVEYTKNNFKNMVKDFARQPLRKSVGGAVKYFKANVMEGIQENAQEAIAHAAENYYIESFKNPELATAEFARAQMMHGIKEQFTAQGFETFASGFVMGAFAGPLNAAPKWASIGYNRIKDPKAYQDYVNKRDNYGAQLVNTLNAVDIKDFYDNPIWTYSSQSQINKSLFEASTEEEVMAIKEKEIRQDAFIKAMSVAMEKDMMDVYYEQISSAENMTQEEFEEAYGLEKGAGKDYQANISKIKERAKSVEERWNKAKELFPEPEDIGELLDSADKNSLEYQQAALLLSAWKEARQQYVFFNESFESTKALMQDLVNDVVNLTSKLGISATDAKVLFDKTLLSNEIGLLKTDVELVESMENLTPEQKKELKEKKEKLEALTELRSAIISYENINQDKQEILEQGLFIALEEKKDEIEKLLPEDKAKFIEDLKVKLKPAIEALYESKKELVNPRAVQLQISFKEYIRVLNKDKDYEFQIQDPIDQAYFKFKRFLELDKTQKETAKVINTIGDEQGFLNMIETNMGWMKQLYDNRREYYEQIIKTGFEQLENNDLLNALANKGIYISEEALEDWVENSNIPEEFFLEGQEAVIREGHHLYEGYVATFVQVARNRNKEAKDVKLKQYQDKIDELIKQRDAAIEALPTTLTRVDKQDLIIKTPSTLDKFVSQLGNNTYADLVYEENGEDKTLTVYQDSEGNVKFNDENGNPFNDSKTKFKSGKLYIMAEKPDQTKVDEIMQEYAELIAKVEGDIQAYKAKNNEPYVNITKETPYSEMPVELQDKLKQAYLKESEDIGRPVPEDAGVAEDDMIKFIKTSKLAATILDEYNKTQNALNNQPQNYDPVFVDADGNEKKASEFTEKELKDKLKILDADIKALEEKEELTTQEEADLNNYKATKLALENYKEHVKALNLTEAQRKVQALYKEKVLDVQKEILTPDDTNSNFYEYQNSKKERVTNLTRDIKTDEFANTDIGLVVTLYNNYFKTKNYSPENFQVFVKEFKSQKYAGFQKENTQDKFLKALELKINEDLSQDQLIDLINAYQWQEARDIGNFVHNGVETLFYGGTVERNPNVLTDEAYEQLFGSDGVITKVVRDLKAKNMLFLGSENKVVGEKYAGTMDMVLVDPEGTVHIVDIKTGKDTKWKSFVAEQNDNRVLYSLQLAAYSVLLQGMLNTKVKVSTKVLPVQVAYDKKGVVTSAKSPTQVNNLLLPNDNFIEIDITKPNQAFKGEGDVIPSALDKILEKIPAVATPQPGIKVATAINPILKQRLINAGVPESIINQMTKEEQAEVASYTDKVAQTDYVNSLISKYSKVIDSFAIDEATQTEQKVSEDTQVPEISDKELNQRKFDFLKANNGKIITVNGITGTLNVINNFRYEIETEDTIYEYQFDQITEYSTPEKPLSKYNVQNVTENSVTVNNVDYTINVDEKGNIESLSPSNKPEQKITNEALVLAVEIERNKLELENVNTLTLEEDLRINHADINAILENIWGYNLSENVASILNKLYDNKKLTEAESLAADLWLQDIGNRIFTLIDPKNSKEENEAIEGAYETYEIIYSLLYNLGDLTIRKDGKRKKARNVKEVKDNVAPEKTKKRVASETPKVTQATPAQESTSFEQTQIDLLHKHYVELINYIASEYNISRKEAYKRAEEQFNKGGETFGSVQLTAAFNYVFGNPNLTLLDVIAIDAWAVRDKVSELKPSFEEFMRDKKVSTKLSFEEAKKVAGLTGNTAKILGRGAVVDITSKKALIESYRSVLGPNFKNAFVNVEAEVYLYEEELKALEESQATPAQESTVILDSFAISEDVGLVEPGYSKLYETYAEQMQKATTITQAIQIYQKASKDENINVDELKALADLVAQLRKTLPEPSATTVKPLTLAELKSGDVIVRVDTGESYKVVKFGDTIEANSLKQGDRTGYIIDQKNISNFVKTSDVGKTLTPETSVTPELTAEDKALLKDTKDTVDVFLTQKNIKAELQQEVGDKVSSEKLENLENNLLDNIFC
jgi:hypothetical protein